MDSQALGALVVTIVIFIGIFLLFREFFCWYWKINERIALQKDILAALNGKAVRFARDDAPLDSAESEEGVDDPDALREANERVRPSPPRPSSGGQDDRDHGSGLLSGHSVEAEPDDVIVAIVAATGAEVVSGDNGLRITGIGEVGLDYVDLLDRSGGLTWASEDARKWFHGLRSDDDA
jgi:hypothetical protein